MIYWWNTTEIPGFLNSFRVPHIINSRFAVIYMPMETVTVQTIPRLGFFKVPGAYGLMSKASLDAPHYKDLHLTSIQSSGKRGNYRYS